jgi:hypothetical protein
MLWIRILAIILSLGILGCGAAPGGDSLDGANGDLGLPLSGAAAKVQTSWSLFKDGSLSAAKQSFQQLVDSEDATAVDLAEAHAGIGWVNVKQSGSSAGIADFRAAIAKSAGQADARVGLAGALISKGTRTDLDEVVEVLKAIDSNNANFIYVDQYNVGVSNAEAHAMLAYAYFVQGNRAKADQQIKIASDLDAENTGTSVDQIQEILSFIP